MTHDTQRFATVALMALLGAGIIAFMIFAIMQDGKMTAGDSGWMAAAFLSLREVFSKMEKVSLGIRTPAKSIPPDDL